MFTPLETVLGFCLTVTVVIIVLLWLLCLRRNFIIEEMRNEIKGLKEELVTERNEEEKLRGRLEAALKKVKNAELSLQTVERDIKGLRKNLAE